ncbi:MAG: glycoside hydrolase family protein [Planctomycetota bacterium]|jgi:hypothetical protein|nr:glycoside hydrolase family protein [Planctomycetota bacterium]
MSNLFTFHPVARDSGFHMDTHWVWCGSVVRGEDGRYHMFASRWPKTFSMSPHWLFHSEVVRAVSDRPEGPYLFEEVVLERRGPQYFDGMNTHNPSIRFWDGTYYLYYMGTSYDEQPPQPGEQVPDERVLATWNRKRIGLASSTSVFGPWTRRDEPLLLPRPGHWDCTATTNPSAAILPDGTTYMIYKSRSAANATLRLGMTRAARPDGPFERLSDEPLFNFSDPNWHVEDPFFWHDPTDGRFHVVMKDDYKGEPAFAPGGGITGEWGAGVHASSEDALNWEIHGKAYPRSITWDDGTTTVPANLERPFLLFQDGKPSHLFAAHAQGPRPWHFTDTWNVCLPIA